MLSTVHIATNWTLPLYRDHCEGRGAKTERDRRWEDKNKTVSSGSDMSLPLMNSLQLLLSAKDPQKSNPVIILIWGEGVHVSSILRHYEQLMVSGTATDTFL